MTCNGLLCSLAHSIPLNQTHVRDILIKQRNQPWQPSSGWKRHYTKPKLEAANDIYTE